MQALAWKSFAYIGEPPYKALVLPVPQPVEGTVTEDEMLGVSSPRGQALANILRCRTESRIEPHDLWDIAGLLHQPWNQMPQTSAM